MVNGIAAYQEGVYSSVESIQLVLQQVKEKPSLSFDTTHSK
uniref:Uncharacterized protein n=1 Tax=Utricularia reniformis TaxID=192314 RepID=A0A1Y0B2H4_9LAMI|nr:hypothetical protein AEK19_MT1464 [Utricularia reniformis]ART31655.1 hypothetical protein AEK19_MT1464 [Utricularia reniformis]